MNLQNLNVTELSAQEVQDTNGGGYGGWLWQTAVATFLYNVVADWEENVEAFHRGSKSGAEAVGGTY